MFETQKYGNTCKTSSGEIGLDIGTHASPKVGQDQVSGGVSVLCTLFKNPFKSHFKLNSRHCSTTILLKHITSALTAVKDHVIKYSETSFSNSNVNYFWSIKNSSEVVEKLRLRNFQGSQVSSFDFPTLNTSLPHDLIKAKVLSLVNDVSTESQKRTSVLQT